MKKYVAGMMMAGVLGGMAGTAFAGEPDAETSALLEVVSTPGGMRRL